MQSVPVALFSIFETIQAKILIPQHETPNTNEQPLSEIDIAKLLRHEDGDGDASASDIEGTKSSNLKSVHQHVKINEENISYNINIDTAQLQESLTQIPTDDEYEPEPDSVSILTSDYGQHSIDSSDSDSSDWDNFDSNIDSKSIDTYLDNNDISPYTANDYRSIQTNEHENEHEYEDEDDWDYDIINDTTMNWNDNESVQTIRELMAQLLLVASTHQGIREDELYLMFATPTPQSIIQHLRFGLLSDLCEINIDRFGRRSYFYRDEMELEENHHINHVFSGSNLPSKLNVLLQNDMSNLRVFMTDTPSVSRISKQFARYSIIAMSKINNKTENNISMLVIQENWVD